MKSMNGTQYWTHNEWIDPTVIGCAATVNAASCGEETNDHWLTRFCRFTVRENFGFSFSLVFFSMRTSNLL